MATHYMAKGGGLKQTAPQETDSTYSKSIDKQVAGKPVGWRFSDKLAKKLGKKPGTKPTKAEIEKYKNDGVYFETRKNKSDVNPKNKLAKGGGVKQSAPQETDSTYSKSIDKQVSGKPVGWRFTDKKAKSLKKKTTTRPTAAEVEKYGGKGVYFETRKNKSDINPKAKLEDGGDVEYAKGGKMKEFLTYDEINGLKIGKWKCDVLNIDIGGGPVVWENPSSSYMFYAEPGFDGERKLHFQVEMDEQMNLEGDFNAIVFKSSNPLASFDKRSYLSEIKKVIHIIERNKDEELTPNDFKKDFVGVKYEKYAMGGDVEYAKGGQTSPQRESYSKRGDAQVKAKPAGYRFTEKQANKLGKSVYTKPTAEQVEKYIGRGVYFENRKDKSDVKPNSYLAKGGQTSPQRESYSKRGDAQVKAKPVGYRFTDARAKRLGKSATAKPTAEEIAKYLGDGVYFENRKDKSDVKPASYLAKGGQTSPQRESYSKRGDAQVKAKPAGYRFTEKLANRLGKNVYTKPTAEQVEKYSGKKNGIYFENRKDKSDVKPTSYLAKGGGVPRTSNADSKAYTENHLPFMANNLEGKTLENGDYVVLSYGYYPIWFWHKRTNKWYGNKDKFSVSTAKHISQSRPTYEATMLSRGEMDSLMAKSIDGKDFKEFGGTLDSFVLPQQ